MKKIALVQITVFVMFASYATFASADSAYVSPQDTNLKIKCTCVATSQLCQSKLFDQLTGSERNTWFQVVSVKAAQPTDLDAACYRKRDVDGFGSSLCCTVPNDEATSIKNLFRGEPQ